MILILYIAIGIFLGLILIANYKFVFGLIGILVLLAVMFTALLFVGSLINRSDAFEGLGQLFQIVLSIAGIVAAYVFVDYLVVNIFKRLFQTTPKTPLFETIYRSLPFIFVSFFIAGFSMLFADEYMRNNSYVLVNYGDLIEFILIASSIVMALVGTFLIRYGKKYWWLLYNLTVEKDANDFKQ